VKPASPLHLPASMAPTIRPVRTPLFRYPRFGMLRFADSQREVFYGSRAARHLWKAPTTPSVLRRVIDPPRATEFSAADAVSVVIKDRPRIAAAGHCDVAIRPPSAIRFTTSPRQLQGGDDSEIVVESLIPSVPFPATLVQVVLSPHRVSVHPFDQWTSPESKQQTHFISAATTTNVAASLPACAVSDQWTTTQMLLGMIHSSRSNVGASIYNLLQNNDLG